MNVRVSTAVFGPHGFVRFLASIIVDLCRYSCIPTVPTRYLEGRPP